MKINIARIPDAGLELSEKLDPGDLDLERADIRFSEPINISAQVTKGINNVSVNLKLTTTLHLNCSRCLEEFSLPLAKEIKLNILIESEKEIDISDKLRQEIILGYPLKPLCRDDCCGLCLGCGQSLNKGRCSCKPMP